MKTKYYNRRKRAGKRFRKQRLMVRAWEKQECKPCGKWLLNPLALEMHLASRLHKKKAGSAKGEGWKDLPRMWLEAMQARVDEAERVEREKLKVMARTDPDACRKEIWAMANDKHPNSIHRKEACGVVARRILQITTNVKCELAAQEVTREGWDHHGHSGRPWEPLRQFKEKKKQKDEGERFIANARLY